MIYNAKVGEGPFVLITSAYLLTEPNFPETPYKTEQRFLSPESRAEFKIMAQRHGIQIEKEYDEHN